MNQKIIEVVERVLAKAPQWIRQDFVSADPAARTRAEESLAAMIGGALDERDESSASAEP